MHAVQTYAVQSSGWKSVVQGDVPHKAFQHFPQVLIGASEDLKEQVFEGLSTYLGLYSFITGIFIWSSTRRRGTNKASFLSRVRLGTLHSK